MEYITQLLILFLTCSASAVNKDNFKTCKTSSFCNRQRELKPSTLSYSILPESVKLTPYGFIALLSKQGGNQTLQMDLTYLSFSTFRIIIDEPKNVRYRYRLKTGDSLQTDPKPHAIDITRSADSLKLLGSLGDMAIVNFHPFTIKFYIDNSIVCLLNHRGLFNFEEKLEVPTELPVDPSPATPVEPKKESKAIDESDSSNSDKSEQLEGARDTPESDPGATTDELNDEKDIPHEELIVTPSPPNPHPWVEYFKEHRDTRPNGPSSISLDIDFPGVSHTYGIPEHTDGFVLKSTVDGDPYRLYNLDVFEYEVNSLMALYGSVPVLVGLNKNHTIGVFWHNPSETWIDIDYTDRPPNGFFSKIPRLFSKTPDRIAKTRWISESGVVDVFIMLGRKPSDISKAYSHLTGTTPLPPLFALAYHQSRWNYVDEADVMSIDKNFDQFRIPLDVIWLDIEHTDGKRYFTWDKAKFANAERMVDALSSKGRKLVTVVDPHIKQDQDWDIYKNCMQSDNFVKSSDNSTYVGWCWPGSSSWPDFTSPRVQRSWSELFLTYHPVRVDTMFTWNDMNEPSVFSGPEITMHKDALHEGNWEHRDVHNIYSLNVHMASWNGQLMRSGGQERPFVLARAFFAGSQRTAAVWTGDNTASWDHLRITVPMMLSLSLTGITFCGADVGGFFGNTDPELLARWYQAAAFQPFFRAHKHMDTKRHEPWTFPEEYLNVVRDAIVERYKLLPYWYTTFARFETDGQPVMAPIWYHFRDLSSVYDLDNEYLVGESILVRPVTSSGARSVDVYIPPGVWYHHKTLRSYEGNQLIEFSVSLSTIPIFYRGGSIIPRRERIRRSSWIMRNDPYTIFVLIDPKLDIATGFLYDDDYHSTSRDSARFHQITYSINRDPTTHAIAGGRLHVQRIPLPGTSVLPEHDNAAPAQQKIERLVFVGLQVPVERVTLIKTTGERQNIPFVQPPTSFDDKRYHGDLSDGVITIRPTDLSLTDDWQLYLLTGKELKEEL